MGNQQTIKTYQPYSYLAEWQTIDHMQNYNIVLNTKTNQLGQSRKYKLDPIYDLNQQLMIYEMRSRADQPIVKAYSAAILEKVSKRNQKEVSGGICASNNHIGVVTQRIPYTLDELPQLTFPETLYILRKSLQGYQHLYPRTGPVHITPKMLGLNPKSELKIWINQDFSQNHPNNQIKSLISTRNQKLDRQYNLITPKFRDQKQMIQNIIDVVEDKCQYGMFNSQFHNQIRQNCYSFVHVREYLEDYIRDNVINVPNKIMGSYGRLVDRNNQRYQYGYEQNIRNMVNKQQPVHNKLRTSSQPQIIHPVQNPTMNNLYHTINTPPISNITYQQPYSESYKKIPNPNPITQQTYNNSTVSYTTTHNAPHHNPSYSTLHTSPSQNKIIVKFTN